LHLEANIDLKTGLTGTTASFTAQNATLLGSKAKFYLDVPRKLGVKNG